MHLAPFNYDYFFKKVFSEPSIAKCFLEDFLGVSIQAIDPLKIRHTITDSSKTVEVDYRCKIDDRYIIIDMQQWYKKDIAQRFFLYHSLNTVLQLETLPTKSIEILGFEKPFSYKDYTPLEPVYTLVWMVDDTLQFTDDYVSYIMTPEAVVELLKNKELWQKQEVLDIVQFHKKTLELLNNEQMKFLSKSKLVFMFQRNIVSNPKLSKYKRWFEFAHKTKNKDNRPEDFQEYLNDPVFSKIIHKLRAEDLSEEESYYTLSQAELLMAIERYNNDLLNKGEKIGIEKGEKIGIEKGEKIGIEKGEKIGIEKGEKIGIKKAMQVLKLSKQGKTHREISLETGLSIPEIEEILREFSL